MSPKFALSRYTQRRPLATGLLISVLLVWCLLLRPRQDSKLELQQKNPLLWKHVHTFDGTGGEEKLIKATSLAWYIPQHWLPSQHNPPKTILEAALIASRAAKANTENRTISNSAIPLILHQMWKNRRIETWSTLLQSCVEKWLEHVVRDEMAYFFWEDDGIMMLLEALEPDFVASFKAFPVSVERTDVFRILALKWFGGIYSDVDTLPLRAPATWVTRSDIEPWTDAVTGQQYNSTESVSLILGIEADTDPASDSYWRMGYFYPIQLTQWAFAASPGQQVLLKFMDTLSAQLQAVRNDNNGSLHSPAALKELQRIGPLALTGPAAVTAVTQTWLHTQIGLRWNALSGLLDNGRSKLIHDVLILPITAFSPGRERYRNMGSRPVTDPEARLWHRAQGSWRSFDIEVEYGKICRTLFARCRDWPKTKDV